MNFIKKIISLILLISIFTHSIVSAAIVPDVSDEYLPKVLRVLDYFDILYDMEIGGNFRPDETVTRGEAAAYILKLAAIEPVESFENMAEAFLDVKKDNEYYNEIYTALDRGIIVGYGTEFEPEKNITYAECVKMLCTYMGYDKIAQSRGGYPGGYLSAAADIGLSKKVKSTDGDLSRRDFAVVLYNALTAPLMTMSFAGDEAIGTSDNEHTILSDKHRMIYGEGIIEANAYTSLYTVGGVGIDNVKIDDMTFNEGSTEAGDLIGRYVEYYAKETDKDEYELAIIWADEERFAELDAADIIVEDTGFDNIYYQEDDKEKRYRLSQNANLIYNGQAVLLEDISQITPKLGTVVVSDTDNDGKYDVIIVSAYEVFIADSVILSEEKIVYKDNKGFLKLDDKFRDISIVKNGEKIGVDKIDEWDVVQVLMPPQANDGYLKIVISAEKASGTLNSIGEEKIIIGGDEFKYSSGYQPVRLSQAKAGENVTALLDIYGRVVDVQTVIGSDICGFLYKAVYVDEDESALFTIFNESGEWVQLTTGKKIKFNDESIKPVTAVEKLQCTGDASGTRVNDEGFLIDIWERPVKNTEGVFSVITDGNGVMGTQPFQKITKRQLVLYTIDKNGLIKSIKTADCDNKAHAFVTLGDYSAEPGIQYRDGQKAFYIYRWGGNPYPSFYADEDTKVFQIPFERPDVKKTYRVIAADTSWLSSNDINCYAKTYGFADTKSVDGVPYMVMPSGGDNAKVDFIVTKTDRTLDEDDLPVYRVTGLSGNHEVEYTSDDRELFKKPSGNYLKPGDAITYSLNADGTLRNIYQYGNTSDSGILFDTDLSFDDQLGHVGSYRFETIARGYVTSVNYSKKRIEINNGEKSEDGKDPVFGMWRVWTNTIVYVTDLKTGKVRTGDINDISVSDFISVLYQGSLNSVYVYKNN